MSKVLRKVTRPVRLCMAKCSGGTAHQFLMLGLENAGKSTLLYRLKIKDWKAKEMVKDLDRLNKNKAQLDPGYHYEEFSGDPTMKYGIWDVPGSEVMRQQWPIFYRYVKITACIFVVDGLVNAKPDEPNPQKKGQEDIERDIESARYWLHRLFGEDELRQSAIVLIINVKEDFSKGSHKSAEQKKQDEDRMKTAENALREMLGLSEILEDESNKKRFLQYTLNIAHDVDGETGGKWPGILADIAKFQAFASSKIV